MSHLERAGPAKPEGARLTLIEQALPMLCLTTDRIATLRPIGYRNK